MAYLTRMVLRGAAPQRGAKKHAALRVGLKCPVCFVVGSRRLIIESRLNPPPRIRDISDPSQSRPLLGLAPGRKWNYNAGTPMYKATGSLTAAAATTLRPGHVRIKIFVPLISCPPGPF